MRNQEKTVSIILKSNFFHYCQSSIAFIVSNYRQAALVVSQQPCQQPKNEAIEVARGTTTPRSCQFHIFTCSFFFCNCDHPGKKGNRKNANAFKRFPNAFERVWVFPNSLFSSGRSLVVLFHRRCRCWLPIFIAKTPPEKNENAWESLVWSHATSPLSCDTEWKYAVFFFAVRSPRFRVSVYCTKWWIQGSFHSSYSRRNLAKRLST